MFIRVVIITCLSIVLTSTVQAKINGKVVVGFSQIGAESDWRVANSKSVKEAAAASGVYLIFSDAQQSQANQIKAVKSFILQKVDVIVIAPVVTAGWHDVLVLAKNAGIPVIILDRQTDETDESLYATYIGPDQIEEGRRSAVCLIDQVNKKNMKGTVNVVVLEGTPGSASSTRRKKGFGEVMASHPNFKVIKYASGDFKENLGKEVMEKIIKESKVPIHALFAHNDNMALGAIASLDQAGLEPGKKIVVVSVDAVRNAFLAMKAGKLNCTVECSPLSGPQLMSAIKDLLSGKTLPRWIQIEEGVFPSETAEKELPNRKY